MHFCHKNFDKAVMTLLDPSALLHVTLQAGTNQTQLKSYFISGVKLRNEKLEKSSQLWSSLTSQSSGWDLFKGFCDAGLFFQVMPRSGILDGWQRIDSLKGLFSTCHFFLQCLLTNRGGIGVTDVGSGFSRQICDFEFVQRNCLRTVLGYACAWAVGV